MANGCDKFLLNAAIFLIPLAIISCGQKKVDFSAEVKPILNKHCISCHGGVKRNAKFSLLFRHEAIDTAESGKRVIVPGDASHSEMVRRITSNDPEVRMPYKEAALSTEEIDILTRWIDQGAEWGDHWAYVPPTKVEVPGAKTILSGLGGNENETWIRNPIDNFILEKLSAEKLTPSKEADKAILVRRLYMDITGLPPSEADAKEFIDGGDEVYAKTVDKLLASPQFGEKWASWWLDMARYADTKGYEKDQGRSMWKYRDWVIKAFNQDKPFDQFTREQLAGDLLPNPTDEQLIATAFHRNTMNNDEGGTDDEEFRVAALVDRVSTTWEVWQSTTMACVQCHTHPYDPFVNEEYYKSMAFLNNTRDEDTPGEEPNLRIYTPEDQKHVDALKAWVHENGNKEQEEKVALFLKTMEPKYHPHTFDQIVNGSLIDNKFLGNRPGGSARIKAINLSGKRTLLMNYWATAAGGRMVVRLDKLDGEIILDQKIEKAGKITGFPIKSTEGKHDLYFSFYNSNIRPTEAVCAVTWIAFMDELPGKDKNGYSNVTSSMVELLNTKVENTPIMIENGGEQFRTTRIFIRGNWMVKGDSVTPGVPASLNPFPKGQPLNRLGFANWLLDKENPLTSRAIVNRFWEQIFGAGIVESLEDFGTQGASPSNQALLDWLAIRFVDDHHWSMKKLVKDLVMSATYRQDSHISPELLERDPYNKLLARGPRVRLTFEQVRDQALSVSGLLSPKMYGKSVMPYQPAGIWSSVYSDEHWEESKGQDEHRRSVYTYTKRTSPYPSMMMFDGSSREVCVSRRIRTNTPLQALVTLNDSSFVVASRHLGEIMIKGGKDRTEQINAGYKRLAFHSMSAQKLQVFESLYDDAYREFKTNDDAAEKLVASKDSTPELAAMTVVANAMLNLDEIITKE
ncbi:MAG: DUF1553 domain-containing protein [Chryseolinea sp.]